MQRQSEEERTSNPSLNRNISRAMELLNSIKKQRELLSQTLSTAKMPKELALDADHDAILEEELNLYSFSEKERRPLSPRNRKADVSDARQLVSSLRSKREDLIKRFEKAQLVTQPNTTCNTNARAENEENTTRSRQKAVVDMSLLEDVKQTQRSSDSRFENTDLSARVKSFQDKIKGMEGMASSPETPKRKSMSESMSKFENRCLNNEESSERRSISQQMKTVAEPWRGKPEERDSTSRPNNEQFSDSLHTREYPSRFVCTGAEPETLTGSNQACHNATWMKNAGKKPQTPTHRRNRSESVPSWIKKDEDDIDEEEQTKRKDSSWIKKSSNELSGAAKTRSDTDTAWIKHDVATKERKFSNTTASSVAIQEEGVKIDASNPAKKSTVKNAVGKGEEGDQTDTSLRNDAIPGAPTSLGMNAKRKSLPVFNGTTSMKRRLAFPSTEDTCEHLLNRKPATQTASWIKQNSDSRLGRVSERREGDDDVPKPIDYSRRKPTPTTPSWVKDDPSPPGNEKNNSAARRHSVGLGKACPPVRGRQDGNSRRASAGDVSWIKKNESCKSTNDALPKAPWVKSAEEQTSKTVAPMLKRIALEFPSRSTGFCLCETTIQEEEDTRDASEDAESSGACSQEPHNLALSDKVSLFESTKKVSPPKTGLQAVRERFEASDKSLSVESPAFIVKAIARPTPTMSRGLPRGAKSTYTIQTKPPRATKISSLINKMEKFSLGGEFDCDASVLSVQSESAETNFGIDHAEIVTRASSLDASLVFEFGEYGDANFSFGGTPQADEVADQKSYLFDESDEASEGSTYKIDNYHKDFNETIPIESPWMHPPMASFEAFADFASSERNTMTIVSIAPSTALPAPSYDIDDMDNARQTCQEHPIRDEKPHTDRSLATRKTYHQVARNSLLSASKPPISHSRSKSLDSFEAPEEADPIFLVCDDVEHKSSNKRSLKKFLSKPKDAEACSSQEENKHSKSVFKILKKGLGSSSSKKDDSEHTCTGTSEASPDDVMVEEYFRAADSRTTISSITRSVTSNPGDATHRSDGSKPSSSSTTMPLGVLNGFFKAARKLQKKSKRKSRRGRSMSNKPPTQRIAEFKPVPMPPTEVQLWPHAQGPIPPGTAIGERRFGAFGGLAASRQAVNTPAPQIQSLASW